MSKISYNKNINNIYPKLKGVIVMPRGDGRGPAGPGAGSGIGRQVRVGSGGGRMGGPASAGPIGYCECPNCGTKVEHKIAEPCNLTKCPKCGSTMVRG